MPAQRDLSLDFLSAPQRTMNMKTMFNYYGGKWRAARCYPAPQHHTLIEPFAGGAGYSLWHHDRSVKLYDKDPVVAGVWDYLIKATRTEIERLPLIRAGQDVRELKCPIAAQDLIGFWLSTGSTIPKRTLTAYASLHPNQYWSEKVRSRIAAQVDLISHWTVQCCSYADIPDQAATWFVDPPYQEAGKYYRYSSIDYADLEQWCRSRTGQTMVCENQGADWLPFRPFSTIKARKGMSVEVLWAPNN